MRAALLAAGARAVDVDHVNAHGTGTRANDEAEARAIAELLGPRAREVPVVSLKGAIGHCLGAAGAMEAVASVLSLRDQVVPPCVGFASLPDNLCLRIPAACESLPLRKVMSVNLAFGGNNAALLFGRRP
jgi:3-oxoacyl-(acyl-carrier-protein) synthase